MVVIPRARFEGGGCPLASAILGDSKLEIPFPINGLHEGLSNEKQPPTTSPYLKNVRPYDVTEERARGGQRPALIKAYETQIGGEYPVIGMIQITTTYIPPET